MIRSLSRLLDERLHVRLLGRQTASATTGSVVLARHLQSRLLASSALALPPHPRRRFLFRLLCTLVPDKWPDRPTRHPAGWRVLPAREGSTGLGGLLADPLAIPGVLLRKGTLVRRRSLPP